MYWRTFNALNPGRDANEETQYLIGGADFVRDLLAFLDILDPIRQLMLKCQSLDAPCWKLGMWWPIVKQKLSDCSDGSLPRLEVDAFKIHTYISLCKL